MPTINFIQRLRIPDYDNPNQVQYAGLSFDTEKCIQCGLCTTACAFGLIEIDSYFRTDYLFDKVKGRRGFPKQVTARNGVNLCFGCLTCAAACPKGVISITQPFRAGCRLEKLHHVSEMVPPKRY